MRASSFVVPLTLAVLATGSRGNLITDLTVAQSFLDQYNMRAAMLFNNQMLLGWAYATNLTDYNQQRELEASMLSAAFEQEAAANASLYNISVMPELMAREFTMIKDIGTSAQTDPVKLARLNQVQADLQSLYSKAKVCLAEGEPCLPLEPDLTNILATSRDHDQLLAVWEGWRDASGRKMKDLYAEFVELSNDAIKILGHEDTGAYWRSWYDTPTFENELEALFNQLLPFYEQLHAYVRRQLKKIYGADKFPVSGHIPAHLTGNMWAQDWLNIVEDVLPYKEVPFMSVTEEMVAQNYTPVKIFQMADDFFVSLGFEPLPDTFWSRSMLEKPKDGRDVVCHASAWDFYDGADFRVKQCTEVNQNHLETAHHETGHIEYDMSYRHQPISFRDGANNGFHEAVGDVISLSVQTPEHMKAIGLLDTVPEDSKSDINFQMSMALQKIAFLPFGYLMDQWRWSVFSGDTTPEHYNDKWWELRCRYQGVSSPVSRTSSDFDPGAKFHIPNNTPYIRYFVSFILQFQFHKALCDRAGYTGPLHRCDIYNNTEAGLALRNMLKLGSSKPWTYAIEQLTGQTKMDAQPLIEYFQPLMRYLREENGNDYGWHPSCPEVSDVSGANGENSSATCLSSLLITLFVSCICFLSA